VSTEEYLALVRYRAAWIRETRRRLEWGIKRDAKQDVANYGNFPIPHVLKIPDLAVDGLLWPDDAWATPLPDVR
jgi:hypothetical protein